MKKIWLDDERIPPSYDWLWVKNINDFADTIRDLGMPDLISFDHDLGEGLESDWRGGSSDEDEEEYYYKYTLPTGYDCAKWLVDHCIDNNLPLPAFKVHSANPVGAENIQKLLENFNKTQKL